MTQTISAFECKMCGHCCKGEGGIIMAAKDQKRLAEFLGLELDEMRSSYTEEKSGKIRLITGDDGYCIFFKQGKGCGVHPGRPDICRAWPFFKGNLIDETSWEMVQEYCPGICAEAGHKEFQRQGLEYLRSLEIEEAEDTPEALTHVLKTL
ncbi:YkgJ family cysteine cluster protein [Desulfobaculum bizertense]|uniref:Zinc-or iron-chelating domain-containing protein n=1 Tax=Desulfobaculum bizertense DSM 18034 TaxID=1121442 RepID=A0A1T4VNK0_9BACT|nr:YkgJ family cysteine cluster protein [Desulfobaculum bizertense]UIJ38145.1 YkgJ family cysteine cluster protein [Desulfobaculum bizertense]SKA66562.1 hypothetical protein SAMN02745702_00620 [Desulfobaculum bizertense DSM 18034]